MELVALLQGGGHAGERPARSSGDQRQWRAAAGLALAAAAGWWLVLVGAASIAAGWFYTAGPKPYGYAGLGEAFVFVFFGVVATVGTTYVHLEKPTLLALAASVPVGALATALLVVNNLRDIATDTAAGKRTLAVRLGDPDTRLLYLVLLTAIPVGSTVVIALRRPWALAALAAGLVALAPAGAVRRGARGRDLVPVLGATGRVQLAYGALLAVAVAVGP